MGDRHNPIKFGPEWLRNLSRERSAWSGNNNSHNAGSGNNTTPSESVNNNASAGTNKEMQRVQPKIQLAKLRYGREEMLALFDKNTEAPAELKNNDILYQTRAKTPTALSATFEKREPARNVMQPLGGLQMSERYVRGRSYYKKNNATQPEPRGRGAYMKQLLSGRPAWHSSNQKMPAYTDTAEEDLQSPRVWPHVPPPSGARSGNAVPEWQNTKMYQSKRTGPNTNWRQGTRYDTEEWRSEAGRSRQRERWGREWADKLTPDKNQSWATTNRRSWVGSEVANSEDNLPEWAIDNAEACGGIFDATGTFHGYSNDDSNLPKTQDPSFALTRSHTQGSFVRNKAAEEGSEEWWASEKAKKLSSKRFDAGAIKFKKASSVATSDSGSTLTANSSQSQRTLYDSLDNLTAKEQSGSGIYNESSDSTNDVQAKNEEISKFLESKTFDSHMRSDINLEEANDERGNFQSVMITPNNSLRQKHQNIVLTSNEGANNLNRNPNTLLPRTTTNPSAEGLSEKPTTLSEYKMVEKIFQLTLDDKELLSKIPTTDPGPLMNVQGPSSMSATLGNNPMQGMHHLSNAMHMGLPNSVFINQNNPIVPRSLVQPTGMQSNIMQQVGITNSALNASLGLPLNGSNNMGIQLQNLTTPVLPNAGIANAGIGNQGSKGRGRTTTLGQGIVKPGIGNQGIETQGIGAHGIGNHGIGSQGNSNTGIPVSTLQSSPSTGAIQGVPGYPPSLSQIGVGNKSLFLGQNTSSNSTGLQPQNNIQMPKNSASNYFPQGVQYSNKDSDFDNAFINTLVAHQNTILNASGAHGLVEHWYYEDPKQIIQGPFSSQEMYDWYRAGFFNSSLLVRRACETTMRPLGSYGPVVPFTPMSVQNVINNIRLEESLLPRQSNTLGLNVDSTWSQPVASSADLMWLEKSLCLKSRTENIDNNMPIYFWDQPSAIAPNTLLLEGIPKEMKTEDQILAQLRASQNLSTPQTLSFMAESEIEPPVINKSEDDLTESATLKLEELRKFIQNETLMGLPSPRKELQEFAGQPVDKTKSNRNVAETVATKSASVTKSADSKSNKQTKNEGEKTSKKSEKNKNDKGKKIKEDKKDDLAEIKAKEKEEQNKIEKRSAETSPTKTKKEEKLNKKDLEKEKKELIKDGFTIVKGSEKNAPKENKKKADDLKANEELERKKKEEKMAAEEEKKKKQLDSTKKQQEVQQIEPKQISELVMKKAPWSAVTNQPAQAPNRDGLTLAEIQRLEREKKLEQIKEQQHMMQIIAQQQAAQMAREQEIQTTLGWAKKKGGNITCGGHSLSEIQAEARKHAVAAAMVATQMPEEPPIALTPPINQLPWGGNTQSGTESPGGFWDTQPNPIPKTEKVVEPPKISEPNKTKKKLNLAIHTKKETSPAAEFENWCSDELASWSSKIDVPTFIGFLKDIESPYEVKDYVKCYLGESKDSSDFARQFLERRSKLLRVGMVTPSDDLCSPAVAVNPRTLSNSDYQEVKGKGKKTKKNKMLKVDARILGFSVTAAEDRINVGDIDTV